MKRGRHDSEYDKIRRDAGLGKPQHEFPERREPTDEADPDFSERMETLGKQEDERKSEAEARHAERRAEFDKRIMLREWAHLGVDPPDPLFSVALARSIGCRIEEVDGEKVLVIPERRTGPVKRREDYGNVEGS